MVPISIVIIDKPRTHSLSLTKWTLRKWRGEWILRNRGALRSGLSQSVHLPPICIFTIYVSRGFPLTKWKAYTPKSSLSPFFPLTKWKDGAMVFG